MYELIGGERRGAISLLCARLYPLSRSQLALRPMQKRCLKPRRKTWPLLIAGEA
jgi:hypothetical protein